MKWRKFWIIQNGATLPYCLWFAQTYLGLWSNTFDWWHEVLDHDTIPTEKTGVAIVWFAMKLAKGELVLDPVANPHPFIEVNFDEIEAIELELAELESKAGSGSDKDAEKQKDDQAQQEKNKDGSQS